MTTMDAVLYGIIALVVLVGVVGFVKAVKED
jgi:hypothetical protein